MLRFLPLVVLVAPVPPVSAGTLTDGRWVPTGCGSAPALPTIASTSVDAYNQSLKAVRLWQAQAQAYHHCLVEEANADNQAIATAANAAQDRFRAQVAEIGATAAANKAKLDGK